MSARAPLIAAGLATCLAALAGRADACSCLPSTVSANEPAGRVFFLRGRDQPEPLPSATVRLLGPHGQEVVAETTTEDDGTFHLGAVRPGSYELRVSLTGFMTTTAPLSLRKRGRDLPRGLAVGVVIYDECSCMPVCATSPEKGAITPRCLLD